VRINHERVTPAALCRQIQRFDGIGNRLARQIGTGVDAARQPHQLKHCAQPCVIISTH